MNAITETCDLDPKIVQTLDLQKICNSRVKHFLSMRQSRRPLSSFEDDIGTLQYVFYFDNRRFWNRLAP